MGVNCVICHAKITHSGITGYRSSMQICFKCHDQRRSEKFNPPADENCLACHKNRESLYPQGPITFGTGDSAVKYEHVVHVAVFGCNTCHMALFPMKKDGLKISFADHSDGKLCFSCHILTAQIATLKPPCLRCRLCTSRPVWHRSVSVTNSILRPLNAKSATRASGL